MTYSKMALVYDALMEEAPYDKWEEFTDKIFHNLGKNIKTVADLGCGTGQITRRLAKNGYQVFGVDYSDDMLSYAEHRAKEDNLSIQWFHQDLRNLQGFQQVDAVISYCDVINYITDKQELQIVFNHVKEMLKENGIFIFDVHSLEHIENDLKGQTFAEIYDDLSYVWLCLPGDATGEVYHDLTFFVLDEWQYERFDEKHHQRTYPIETYRALLEEAGLTVKGIYPDFSDQEITESHLAERLFFVCEKK